MKKINLKNIEKSLDKSLESYREISARNKKLEPSYVSIFDKDYSSRQGSNLGMVSDMAKSKEDNFHNTFEKMFTTPDDTHQDYNGKITSKI